METTQNSPTEAAGSHSVDQLVCGIEVYDHAGNIYEADLVDGMDYRRLQGLLIEARKVAEEWRNEFLNGDPKESAADKYPLPWEEVSSANSLDTQHNTP
jgi:hypothetical protein